MSLKLVQNQKLVEVDSKVSDRARRVYKNLKLLERETVEVMEVFPQISTVTSVDDIYEFAKSQNKDINRPSIISTLKRLSKTGRESNDKENGIGIFITGRRNHPSRFDCSYTLASIARLSLGKSNKLEVFDLESVSEPHRETRKIDSTEYSYQLTKSHEVVFNLPNDFDEQQAEKLCAFIKVLASQAKRGD